MTDLALTAAFGSFTDKALRYESLRVKEKCDELAFMMGPSLPLVQRIRQVQAVLCKTHPRALLGADTRWMPMHEVQIR